MPTIVKITCDGESYTQELNRIVSFTRESRRQMETAVSGEIKSTVKQEVKGAEEIQKAKQEIDSIPADKKVVVTTEFSGVSKTSEDQPAQTGNVQDQEVTVTAKVEGMNDVKSLATALDELPDTVSVAVNVTTPSAPQTPTPQPAQQPNQPAPQQQHGNVQQISKAGAAVGALSNALGTANPQLALFGQLLSTIVTGPVAVFTAAIGIAVATIVTIWDKLIMSADEYAAKLARLSSDAEKHAQSVQKEHDAARGYMSRLQALAAQEVLSNESKLEAAKLIEVVNSKYGNLGVTLADVINKTGALDAAQARLNQRLLEEQKVELARQAAAARKQAEQEGKIAISTNYGLGKIVGYGSYQASQQMFSEDVAKRPVEKRIDFATKMRDAMGTSETDAAAWQKVIDTLEKERELTRQIGDIDRGLAAAKLAADAEINDRKNRELALKTKIQEQSKYEVDYAKLTAAGEYDKAAALKQQHELKQQNLTLTEAEKQAVLDNQKALQAIETGKRISEGADELEIQKALLAGDFERANALKLQLEYKRQGKALSKEDQDALLKQQKESQKLDTDKAISENETELEIQKALLAGEYEKADALKRQLEYKRQGKTLDADQEKALKKQQEAQNAMNLQKSMKDQGKSVLYGAMEQAGMGRAAAYAKALDDAEKTKGGKLTGDEASRTKQLTDLSLQLSASVPVQLGDLGIKTNDLTARGGFSSGAVMPDKDEVNRAIRTNTQSMAEALKGIQTWLDKLDNSIKEGNRN